MKTSFNRDRERGREKLKWKIVSQVSARDNYFQLFTINKLIFKCFASPAKTHVTYSSLFLNLTYSLIFNLFSYYRNTKDHFQNNLATIIQTWLAVLEATEDALPSDSCFQLK